LDIQASVFNPAKVPDLIHIICLYVDGRSSVPKPALMSINGLPSVDATAIPP
jgi:hypothetical protein